MCRFLCAQAAWRAYRTSKVGEHVVQAEAGARVYHLPQEAGTETTVEASETLIAKQLAGDQERVGRATGGRAQLDPRLDHVHRLDANRREAA